MPDFLNRERIFRLFMDGILSYNGSIIKLREGTGMGILLTSGYNFEGYRIKKYLGFCSGECALGTGFLSSLGAGIADILG